MDFKNGSHELRTAFSRNLTKIQKKAAILQPHVRFQLQFKTYHLNGTISFKTIFASIIDKSERRHGSSHILACLGYFMSSQGSFHTTNFFLHLLYKIALTTTFSTCDFEKKYECKYMIFGIGNIIVTRIGQT